MEKCNASEATGAAVVRGSAYTEQATATGFYTATCYDANGNEKWSDSIENLVVNQGKNYLLDQGFATAPTTNNVRMSLKLSAGVPVVGDTYASHASWTEVTSSTIATRSTPAFSAAASGSKTTSTATVFNIIGSSVTVNGCMLVMVPTTLGNLNVTSDTATSNAILYSAGDFSGGAKTVSAGDVLNVTYTASL